MYAIRSYYVLDLRRNRAGPELEPRTDTPAIEGLLGNRWLTGEEPMRRILRGGPCSIPALLAVVEPMPQW